MIRNRCKLYTGPHKLPTVTFSSLPREIREAIYSFALVSASNIVVWSGKWKRKTFYDELEPNGGYNSEGRALRTRLKWRHVNQEATRESLRNLATGLFLCSKTVSRESARVFYMKNTFSFLGQHNWDPVVAWLEGIGATNLSYITSIALDASRTDYSWQSSNGDRLLDPNGFTAEEVYPRNPHLQLQVRDEDAHPYNSTSEEEDEDQYVQYGRVDNINPGIEKIFVLLGQRNSEQRLNITMLLLHQGIYPGGRVPRNDMDIDPDFDWYSMDLPKLVEIFRSLHTQQVEVLWEGEDCRAELEVRREILENKGWIVTMLARAQDTVYQHEGGHYCHPNMAEERIAKFVLKSKELTGTLWADYPCPLNSHVPSGMPEYE